MKLKCLFLTVLTFLFLMVGCNKDAFIDEGSNAPLKSAKVPVPLKGEICMTSNDDDQWHVDGTPYGPVPDLYLSRTALLSGNLSHMGKLTEQSSMTGLFAYLDMDALTKGRVVIVSDYEAVIYGANGDYSELISHIRIDVTDQAHQIITGDYTSTGGSGKFENAICTGVLSGVLPCWNIDGTIEYPK